MESILNSIRLCGLLPCLMADDPHAIASALQALHAEGFPAAEVQCNQWTQAQLLQDALTLAGDLSGMAVGALVADAQQATKEWRAGATWVTLPASEATALPEQGTAFFQTTECPPIASSGAIPPSPLAPLAPLTESISSVLFPLPTSETPSSATLAGDAESDATAARVPAPPFPRLLCCEGVLAARWLAQPTPPMLLVQANTQDQDDRPWLAAPAVLAVRVNLSVTEANAATLATSLKHRWAANMGFTLAHIGLNGEHAPEAEAIARAFSALLGLPHRPQPASHFAGTLVEVMSGGGRGTHGHIGFGTDDLPRAMYFASRAGFAFDPASRKDDALGNPLLYYLKDEIAGFGVHLLQKERRTMP